MSEWIAWSLCVLLLCVSLWLWVQASRAYGELAHLQAAMLRIRDRVNAEKTRVGVKRSRDRRGKRGKRGRQ